MTSSYIGKAAAYATSRPSYPQECLDHLLNAAHLHPGDPVADVGAGTGIFSRQLSQSGLRVTAVEPDSGMLEQCRQALSPYPLASCVQGTDSATGLADGSVRLVTAAQAFHWFDPEGFARECRRILTPDGIAALVWNRRDDTSPLIRENADVCRTYCENFPGFGGGVQLSPQRFRCFFGHGDYTVWEMEFPIEMTLERFLSRNFSSSFAPAQGTEAHRSFGEALTALFQTYSRDGILQFPNRTVLYYGCLRDTAL